MNNLFESIDNLFSSDSDVVLDIDKERKERVAKLRESVKARNLKESKALKEGTYEYGNCLLYLPSGNMDAAGVEKIAKEYAGKGYEKVFVGYSQTEHNSGVWEAMDDWEDEELSDEEIIKRIPDDIGVATITYNGDSYSLDIDTDLFATDDTYKSAASKYSNSEVLARYLSAAGKDPEGGQANALRQEVISRFGEDFLSKLSESEKVSHKIKENDETKKINKVPRITESRKATNKVVKESNTNILKRAGKKPVVKKSL